MSGKDTVSARVPQDTSERFEAYRDDRDISKSEAGKRLIERGLDWESGEVSAGNAAGSALGERLAWGVLAFSLAAFALGYSLPAGGLAAVAGVVFIAVAVNRWRNR